jgi:hypothetical protein
MTDMEPLPDLSYIVTTRDIETPAGLLPAETIGTIVNVYPGGVGYEVEFRAPWECVTVTPDDLRPASDGDIMMDRSL